MRTSTIQVPHPTKQRLLDAGLAMLLEHGYNDLGIQALLTATATPKGSFYHHFKDKEDFALRIIDQYMTHVHAGLDACLDDSSRLPLERVRRFFELTQRSYRKEGYMGCLLGGLGQELSGVSERFRRRIEACFSEIAVRIATCLEQAKQRGDIPADSDPRQMASLLVDCWEGAALRSRLRGNGAPLKAMLDFAGFLFQSAVTLTGLCRLRKRLHLGALTSGLDRMPQVPLRLERQPDLRIPSRQRLEQERRVRTDAATALDDGIEPLKRNVHASRRLDLRDAERFEELLQEHLAGVGR